jgi:hypothetical protein
VSLLLFPTRNILYCTTILIKEEQKRNMLKKSKQILVNAMFIAHP